MTLPLYLVPDLDGVDVGDDVVLDGDEGRHAVAVRRTRVGERLQVTDGRGAAVSGAVRDVAKSALTLRVDERRDQAAPAPELVVVQALPKGDRGELAVEVLTEVGVDVVVPWAAERCVAVWRGERAVKGVARWRATARAASKQARRARFTGVSDLADTEHVEALVRGADVALVLHEAASAPLTGVPVPLEGALVVVVGPEGGLSDAEVARLVDAGALAVRMGPEVLRTSTAGVAACAALLSRTDRWR